MEIINLNNEKNKIYVKNLVIGHFNIIHNGHIKLFSNLIDFSFLIFDQNPSKKFEIYTLEERIENLKKFNPKYIFVFDISKDNCIGIAFINNYLLKKMDIEKIHIGSDFCFGKNKTGDVELLKKYFNVVETNNDKNISTSQIVSFIEKGDIESANKLMPFNLYYYGEVVHGKKIASKMFFPTANILENKKLNTLHGSYVSLTTLNNKEYPSITFIGKPKTISSDNSFVETYIFDFNENIYGQKIKVEILKFIRENKKFNSIDELIININNDLNTAKKYFINKG